MPELEVELTRIRRLRAFCAESYLEAKTQKIAAYFSQHGLKAAVVGVSGGIDSATVLGLLQETQRRFPHGVERIVPLCMPVYRSRYATGQEEGLRRALAQCRAWDISPFVCDLSPVHVAFERQIHASLETPVKNADWAKGQLVSTIRTPALYYAASCMAADGLPAVVVGTVNRDEGAYLGYMGKASDCMVDLQVIADLHKSEVVLTAKRLGVISEILAAIPTGDMFDGRTDTEVFGAPYDFVEMYLAHLCAGWSIPEGWSKESGEQYSAFAANLEALHRFNAHKYLVGSPAVHLNVQASAVPGGLKE